MTNHLLNWRWLLAALPLIPACGSYAPPNAFEGMSREAIVASLGTPDAERQVGAGSRLEFPRGPYGKQTWFVYFDESGHANRVEQVLTEQNFQRVIPGMAQDDVRQLLGRPGETFMLARNRGAVWNYRYDNQVCLWFQVEIAADKTVRFAGNGPLPECNSRRGRKGS